MKRGCLNIQKLPQNISPQNQHRKRDVEKGQNLSCGGNGINGIFIQLEKTKSK
jgi:hypothetical protein